MQLWKSPVGEVPVHVVRAVILEPCRVRDAVSVYGGQVLARFAVDVQLDRDGPSAALLDDSQGHAPVRGLDRAEPIRAAARLQPHRGKRARVRQVEARVGMRRVLDQDLPLGSLWELVVVGLRPVHVGILEARSRGDHLAEVELDLLEQSGAVELRVEAPSLWQAEQRLAAGLPAQRLSRRLASREAGDHDRAGTRLDAQRNDPFSGMRVLPRPEPVAPALDIEV